MSIGIYKFENKVNGHIYIGLSNNIERRYQQHVYDASHIERQRTGIDIAIAKWAGCGSTTLTRHLTSDKIAGKVPNTNEPAHWIELS